MHIAFGYLWGGLATYPPGARLNRRRMLDYELVWIQRGQVIYHVNGRDIPADAGSVILSRPGFDEGYTWDTEKPSHHAYFHFSLREVPAEFGPAENWEIVRKMPPHDIIRPLFDFVAATIWGVKASEPTGTLAAAAGTILSAFVLGPLSGSREEPGVYPESVQRALEFIGLRLQEEPAAEIALKDLAEAAMVSPKHLCRVFAQSLRRSPMDAVMAFRLHQAAQLLVRTDLKLDTVARHCGFATPFHFSRRFKDFYGQPPSVFREEALTGREMLGPLRLGPGLTFAYGNSRQ